jgi:hypothetical protein
LKPIPKPVAFVALLVSAAVGVSSLLLLAAGLAAAKAAWALLGFEAITLVAACLGMLFGLGRFRDAPAIALACVAGTVLAASFLGWMSVTASVGQARSVAGIPLTPVLAARVLCAWVLGLAAAYCVLAREPRSWKPAAIGVALALPIVAVAAAFGNPGTRAMVKTVLGHPIGAVIAFVLLGGLLAASTHLIVGAFALGSPEPTDSGATSRPV